MPDRLRKQQLNRLLLDSNEQVRHDAAMGRFFFFFFHNLADAADWVIGESQSPES